MKILVYTVSDFKPLAVECINLLFENFKISKEIDIDFLVVTSKNSHLNNIPFDFKYKIAVDDFCPSYIGFLKYSSIVPKGYDRYLYLDSDILYFGQINELISQSKDFSIVFEKLKMSNDWFKYQNSNHNYDYFFETTNGINAGSFAFKRLSFLEKVRNLFEPYITNEVHKDARLEQSSFNFAICQLTNFDLSRCFDITPLVQLIATDFPFSKEKKLYHFCGFSNEMASKFIKMKLFLNEKQRTNN